MKINIVCTFCIICLVYTAGYATAQGPIWMGTSAGELVQEARSATKQVPLKKLTVRS